MAVVNDPLICPLLTDFYQITMAYAYWKNGTHNDHAVFEAFFRKCPFKGEFAVFAGLDEVLVFLRNFRFSEDQIQYLRQVLPPNSDPGFFEWLRHIDASELKVYAIPVGTICFPKVPVVRVEGPLAVAQLCETTVLNLINFASLVTTNATRFVSAAGDGRRMVEFGLRRAQGPDGAMTASKYCYLGGFHATSNALAGMIHHIPVIGTHAHAYVVSCTAETQLKSPFLGEHNLMELAKKYRDEMGVNGNAGELTAFVSYALAFPDHFLALVDTYDTLTSGVPNFLCVALALHEIGHQSIGIRLDSGDLSFLSKKTREQFRAAADRYHIPEIAKLSITASNDINEKVLLALKEEGHEIDVFGVGTHLVTCQSQPALGMVYKLVEIRGQPRIKLSDEKEKVTLPCKKQVYRLYGNTGTALLDLLLPDGEEAPAAGVRILARHPFEDTKRVYVTPTKVEQLTELIWDRGQAKTLLTLEEARLRVKMQLTTMRTDYTRFLNPTPYKVSVSNSLFEYLAELWQKELPIRELN